MAGNLGREGQCHRKGDAVITATGKEEAKELKALTGQDYLRKFRKLPNKAPGPDGWTVQVLRALPLQACEWIAEVCRKVELTGEAPAQWTVSLVVLLAKKPQIERPIALCHVVYKAWVKARYYLVERWLEGFADKAPWDAARKGSSCLDVSIGRALQFEIAKSRGKKRAAGCFQQRIRFLQEPSRARVSWPVAQSPRL